MLLSISNVVKSYGADHILTGVTFKLDAREKVALVGRNGAGKTTLLKILTGQIEPDTGHVQLLRGAKVGYLRQEVQVDVGRTVIEEAEEAIRGQIEMRARLEFLEHKLENGEPTDEDLEEYALIHEHFLESEGYSAERDIKVVLKQMGFTEDEFSKPTAKLSGGEKTRLAIARLLLEEPDLLILDEPTNHLDLQATEWLESWIRGYHGAVLLVSHDRTFLENTAERVLEMRDGAVRAWPGPFGKYLQLKAEDQERQAEVARRQEIEIAKMDEYVRRFMNSQRTAQARGRQKLMNRLIENKVEVPKNDRGLKAGFGVAQRSGDLVATCEKLTVGFNDPDGQVTLYNNLEWTVRYGERWGVIGENGAGKSTLVKVLLGELEPLSGRARLGANIILGSFSQDATDLDQELTPLDMMVYELDLKPGEARTLLGRFLITGDDVFRPIKTLSGGEKNKLSLARLTHLNPNLLILDEPTNHLDMDSREALAGILKEYKGTLILVSHDRWLLGQITQQTLDILKSGPIVYPGGYNDYRRKKSTPATESRPKSGPAPAAAKPAPEEPELSPRELSKEISRLEKLIRDVEGQVSRDEAAIKALEDRLANLSPTADVFSLTREHQAMQEQLASTLAAWEEHSNRLERLVAQRG